MFKKTGTPECNYKPHSLGNCFGKMSDQESVKEGLRWILGNRVSAAKQYQKSEKYKRELTDLKNITR